MAPNQQVNESIIKASQHTNKSSKKEVLYDGNLYDVTEFLHRHPGGDKIILNFTEPGEDATIAIQQFHNRSIDKVLKMLKTLPSRPEPVYELSAEMKQVRAKNAAMTADFVKLHQELTEEGMFEPSFPPWIYRFVEIIAIRLIGYSLIMESTGPWAQFWGCFIYAASCSRGLWMLHDFGHISASGNPKVDRFFSAVVCGAGVGWAGKWWRLHHNIHHAMTNRLKLDPDVDLLPKGLIFNKKVMKNKKNDQNFIHRWQVYFLPLTTVALHLQWVIWKAGISIVRNKSLVEIISLLCYWYPMYQMGFYKWLLTTFFFSIYFYGNSGISHLFLPVAVGPMHWIEYAFHGTTDVERGPLAWVDWWMGYLNYQVEHHLFPTLPQFRCPLIKDRVKVLAEKHGLPYHDCSYKDAVIKMITNLESISQFLKSID